MKSLYWHKISTDNIDEADLCLLGIPFDGAASVGKGAAHAPDALRECSSVLPPANRTGRRFAELSLFDKGNVKFSLDWVAFFNEVEEEALKLLETNKFCVFIGGDHSVTIPLANAFCRYKKGKKIGFIHFDSHPDLFDEFEGSKWSHACPLRRVLEEHIESEDLAQIGIRAYGGVETEFYEEHPEILVVEAYDIFKDGYQKAINRVVERFKNYDSIYLTLDIDVLDPAFAPGTGTPEAGGISTRELMEILNQLFNRLPVEAMDLVEISPPLDTTNQITSWAGIGILYEVFGNLADRKQNKNL